MHEELEKRIYGTLEHTRVIHIIDQSTLNVANDLLLGIKGLARQVNEVFDPIISAAHKAHQEAIGQKKKFSGPLDLAERQLKPKITDYLETEERKRREQELAKLEIERKLKEAEIKEGAGEKEEADALIESAAATEKELGLTAMPPPRPVTIGLSMREIWDFEITDENLIPREYLMPDRVKIRKDVERLKAETRIPGVRAFPRKNLAARST